MASDRRLRTWQQAPKRGACALIAPFATIAVLLAPRANLCCAVTPESPEVREVVQKAIGFLATAKESRLGGKCVIALAILKASNDREHPKIREAVAACREAAKRKPPIADTDYDVYSNGIAIIFLAELDATKYRTEIESFLRALYARQRKFGGWGYDGYQTGDTSQTQYGVFGCWQAHFAGVDVDGARVAAALNWLLRTQDPGGAWGYQGKDPGSAGLMKQDKTSPSMLAAGLGSALMCGHMLDIRALADDPAALEDGDLPPAVTVSEKRRAERPLAGSDKVKRKEFVSAVERGDRWFERNFTVDAGNYNAYYLYSVERYQSLHEFLFGSAEAEPDWYNEGFEWLKSRQTGEGSWTAGCGRDVDTAFAVLFLVRSMRSSIDRGGIGGGTLVGGRGLPSNVASARVDHGRLVVEVTKKRVDELIAILNDPKHPDYARFASDSQAAELSGAAVGPDDIVKLERLIRDGAPAVRRIAVRILATRRHLDDVPIFIYAMTDPDRRVVLAARDALRFVSRRIDGFGLEDSFEDNKRFDVIEQWKSWYRSFRPETKFAN